MDLIIRNGTIVDGTGAARRPSAMSASPTAASSASARPLTDDR